jgi:nitrogen regulatory protein PII-like uncharacterized protein
MAEDVKPIPDPTELTSKAVDKAVLVSRQYTEEEITHIRDWASSEIIHLRDWAGIQFTLNERQRLELKEDTEKAVKSALDAAKEAVKEQTTASQLANTKSEVGFKEQLGQQDSRFSLANEGINRELSVLTTRVERIENLKQGGQDVVSRGLAVVFGLAALISILLYVQSVN